MKNCNYYKEINKKLLEENIKQNIKNKKNGVFFINSDFSDELLEYILLDLEKASKNKLVDEITIYINSSGGKITSLFPLVDLIDRIDKPVKTIAIGKAYSAGAMLLLSGTNGYRYAYKHSHILLHEVSCELGYNKNSQIKEDSKDTERINNLLIEMVKESTKMKEVDIKKYFDSNKDIFISSQQALKYGIIDKII